MSVKLFTSAQVNKLKANGALQAAGASRDPIPVVKLFLPEGSVTWLLTEMNADGDIAFGLCDLGLGYPELGYVSIREIEDLRSRALGLPVERDRYFTTDKPLSVWTQWANRFGYITEP